MPVKDNLLALFAENVPARGDHYYCLIYMQEKEIEEQDGPLMFFSLESSPISSTERIYFFCLTEGSGRRHNFGPVDDYSYPAFREKALAMIESLTVAEDLN